MNRGVLLLKAAIGVVGLSLVGVGGFNFISTGCPLGTGACSTSTSTVSTVAADNEEIGCDGDTGATTLVAAETGDAADKSACSTKTQTVAAKTASDECSTKTTKDCASKGEVQTVAAETECSTKTAKDCATKGEAQTVAAKSGCSTKTAKDCATDAAACEAKIKLIQAEGGELPDCCKAKLEQAKADQAEVEETGEG